MSTRMKRSKTKPSHGQEITIRRARAADLPALNELYAQLHLDDYGSYGVTRRKMRQAFENIVSNGDYALMVAEQNGTIAGTLHMLIFRHLGHGLRPMAIVENVVVDLRYRSKGIGERLMNSALTIAKKNRCYKMSLTTHRTRRRAHRFYERLGWKRSHHGYTMEL